MELEPPWKKRKTDPSPPSPPPSLLSLPDEIILNCLARVSKSYYPKLSLVSKTFRSLVLSIDLNHARFHHKTQEPFFNICLKFPDLPLPSWFTLWIKPDQIDNEKKKKPKKKEKKKKVMMMSTLVKVPSSYASREPLFLVSIGSNVYAFKQNNIRSRVMLVRDEDSVLWRRAPDMNVARVNPVACVLDEKIYVMGGCGDDATMTWGEVFDIKTQTWEALPDPKLELRFSSIIKRLDKTVQGKLLIRSNEEKDSVYDPRKGKWKVEAKVEEIESRSMVGNVWYSCRSESILWYDTKSKKWELVKGLSSLNKNVRRGLIETISYNGKLLILWDKFAKPGRQCQEKSICCAMVSFENRQDGQVWGKLEWSNVVLTVPKSYAFMRSTYIRC